MSDEKKQVLVAVDTGADAGEVTGSMGDVTFPAGVLGWTDVLDCRHGRFAEMDAEALRDVAAHSRKRYILLYQSDV